MPSPDTATIGRIGKLIFSGKNRVDSQHRTRYNSCVGLRQRRIVWALDLSRR